MTDDVHERRLAAFLQVEKELIAQGVIATRNEWCERAGMRYSRIGEFVSGRTRVPTDDTYERLAAAVGVSVARLKGDTLTILVTEEEREYISLLRALPAAERRRELRALQARLDADHEGR